MTTPAIRRLAADQHGMLTRPQLLNAGVGPDTIDHWVKDGRLIRIHQGVYALGHLPPSPHARSMAGTRVRTPGRPEPPLGGAAVGPDPALGPGRDHRAHETHPTGRDRPPEPVDRPGHDPPARTLHDLTAILDPAALTRAVNDARLAHLLNVDDLPPKLRPRAANPTRSAFEDAFVTFCKRHRLPPPEINAIVAGYEVDAYWHPQRLIAELDGRDYHEHFETDRAKDSDLLEAGFRVIRLTWERLTRHATREAQRFRVLLA